MHAREKSTVSPEYAYNHRLTQIQGSLRNRLLLSIREWPACARGKKVVGGHHIPRLPQNPKQFLQLTVKGRRITITLAFLNLGFRIKSEFKYLLCHALVVIWVTSLEGILWHLLPHVIPNIQWGYWLSNLFILSQPNDLKNLLHPLWNSSYNTHFTVT